MSTIQIVLFYYARKKNKIANNNSFDNQKLQYHTQV